MTTSVMLGQREPAVVETSVMPYTRKESYESFSGVTLRVATLTYDLYDRQKEMVVLYSPDGRVNGYRTGMKLGRLPEQAEKQCRDSLFSWVVLNYVCPHEITTRF